MTAAAPRLILASTSPRRCQLLAKVGFQFKVLAPGVAEIQTDALTAREMTCWNALRKGLAVARARPNDVVLAADTLVALNDEIIGKPADSAQAARMLQRLSGKMHLVATSVFIGSLSRGRAEIFSEISRVVFKKLSHGQIENYLAKIDPLDKAGAYAVQDDGERIIARIIGSRSNVIGLPLEKTRAALARFAVCPGSPTRLA